MNCDFCESTIEPGTGSVIEGYEPQNICDDCKKEMED